MALVLVACDDVTVQRVLSSEVEAHGHRAISANTGLDVLETVPVRRPDMVILSTSLPVHNGLEVAQALRQDPGVPASLPIVLVTAGTAWTPAVERAGVTELFPLTHSASDVGDLLARRLPASPIWNETI